MRCLFALLGFDLGPIQAVETMNLGFSWGWAAVVLLLALLLPLFLWFLRPFEGKPITGGLAGGLTALRIGFVVGVVCLLAGLRCTVTGWVPQKNKLAVLIDTSRSMSIVEEGKSRLERVRQALVDDALLTGLERQTGLSPALFSFAGTVAPLAAEDVASFALQAEGTQTNLSKAIGDVANHLGEGNLLGMVVLTDGGHNHGDNPLDALGRLRTPLYFLAAGRAGQTRDLAVTLDRPPSLGYLNSMTRVRGEIRLHRVATDTVPVQIRRDGKLVETIAVPVPAGQSRVPFAFNIPCETEGTFTYAVAVPQLENELTLENNESGFLIKVVKERLKVLIVANAPSWDLAFLRWALKSDPNSHVDAWVRLTDTRWSRMENFVLKGIRPAPELGPDLEDADVLVVSGVAERVLAPHAEAITRRVEAGKMGLLVLPAARGYRPLGYAGSPLAALLPVDVGTEAWRGVPSSLALPAAEPGYAFLRLLDDPVENALFFKAIPKLDGLFTYGPPKPGAEVLLTSSLDQNGRPAPALVQQRVGRGQVAMLLGGPLWPMGFKMVPTDRTIKPYTAFVLNLCKWLANRREDALVTLETPSARGFVGQPSVFRVWVMDSRRQYVTAAQVSAVVEAKGREPVTLSFIGTSEKGCYEATFVPPWRGLYAVTATARAQGKVLGEAKGEFLVEVPTAEFDNPEVQVELMQQLASATGGAFFPVEQTAALVRSLRATPGQKRETRILDFRDSYLVLALLLALPLAEWILRRTKGLS
ncbi:MAG: Threonine dehydrogenase [Candidatus Ozemobacter sibiricus]|jgi:hypothetical protein|uniref:Threonine dehydrogenase n=1 Tax=Candidatus Ozemobacter sibiricus TaxID=2268124 RepID=A0A367ZM11_9BACT|nr:MAG: Threonine dehydrogenase [Candidatus Ozemobacter sibiricus]